MTYPIYPLSLIEVIMRTRSVPQLSWISRTRPDRSSSIPNSIPPSTTCACLGGGRISGGGADVRPHCTARGPRRDSDLPPPTRAKTAYIRKQVDWLPHLGAATTTEPREAAHGFSNCSIEPTARLLLGELLVAEPPARGGRSPVRRCNHQASGGAETLSSGAEAISQATGMFALTRLRLTGGHFRWPASFNAHTDWPRRIFGRYL